MKVLNLVIISVFGFVFYAEAVENFLLTKSEIMATEFVLEQVLEEEASNDGFQFDTFCIGTTGVIISRSDNNSYNSKNGPENPNLKEIVQKLKIKGYKVFYANDCVYQRGQIRAPGSDEAGEYISFKTVETSGRNYDVRIERWYDRLGCSGKDYSVVINTDGSMTLLGKALKFIC